MGLIKHYEGEGCWNGIFVDGFLPKRDRLEMIYERNFVPTESEPFPKTNELHRDDMLFDVLQCSNRSFCQNILNKYPSVFSKVGSQKYRRSACNLFLMGNDGSKPLQPPLDHFSEEFEYEKNNESYRIIVLFERFCPEPLRCINQSLEKAEFTIKKPEQYYDYERFEKAAKELLDKGSCYFNAPCMMFADDVNSSGLDVLY